MSNTNFKERLTEFISEKMLTQNGFESKCGLTSGTIKNIKDGMSVPNLNKILKAFPDINMNWLVSGNGRKSVLEIEDEDIQVNEDTLIYHYTLLKNFFGIIGSGELKSSSITNSNDLTEKYNHSKCQYICFCMGTKNHKGMFKQRMWSQYGDENQGVCIEIKLGDLLSQIKGNSSIERFKIEYKRPTGKNGNIRDWGIYTKEDLRYKNIEWKEENEYRFLCDKPFSFKIDKSVISNVYLGVYENTDFEVLSKIGYNDKYKCLWQVQGNYGISPLNKFNRYIDIPDNLNLDGVTILELPLKKRKDVSLSEGKVYASHIYENLCKLGGSIIRSRIKTISEIPEDNKETRPRIPYLAAAGTLTAAIDGIKDVDCERMAVINAFPEYDFTIFAYGDSMLPEIKSGDELACRKVKDKNELQWGKAYVLDTDDGIVVKNIYDDGEYLLCKSENPKFHDFRKMKSEIHSISLIVGILRRY